MRRVAAGLLVAVLASLAPARAVGQGGPAAIPPAAAPRAPGAPPVVALEDAVRRAILRATTSLVAAGETRRVEGLLWQVRSGALPSLGANATYTRLDSDRVLQDRVVASKDQDTENVALSVPLVAPARWYQWSHASDQVGVARASELDVRRTAALTAARSYLAVVAQKRVIDVTRRAAQVARAHYEFAHERRAGGVGNAVDEIRAEQQLATAEAQLEAALTQLVRAQEALGGITGEDGPLDAAADPALAPPAERPEDALRDATAVRADVRAARDRAEAARRVERDSWADWLPTVLASAQAFRQHPASLTTPDTGWQAQVILSLPLFEGGLRVGQRKERSALAGEARDQLDGLLRQARSEVRTAFASVEHAEISLGRSRVAADRADAALELVTEAYRAGATTSLDVIDATQRASDAATAAVVAEDAVRQARLDLLAATGRFP